mmetsp:Transcript_7761/g.19854  ORF Transcript_7761/g.19854 Transcript_7761/m.19854 type:complete len:94 (-) Transcript_7761:12-293(-)
MSHELSVDAASLRILSWNVASWATTARHIAAHFGSVSQWLDRQDVDILCLQETKVPRERVADFAELKPHAEERGNESFSKTSQWDSFWACASP